MGFFTPGYLKEALNLEQGASKVLHHHRDLLSEKKRTSLENLLRELKGAIKDKNREPIRMVSAQVEKEFSSAISVRPHAVWSENIEAIVVAIALAIGFQAYFLKPFKIPTGSMQPTLYGMTGHPSSAPLPGAVTRAIDFIKLGRSHLDIKAPVQEQVLGLNERTMLNFFTFTEVVTSAGNHSVFAPKDVVARDFGVRPGRIYEQGESIIHGYVQAGDQVFVDRMTFQFRNPDHADVFVFKTTGIQRIEMNLDPALGSQFYIKRLAGISGDSLRINSPKLFINDREARNPAFQRVMSCENGYRGYSNPSAAEYLTTPGETFTVPGHSFFALGDNSYNSSDSRFWGIVPEHNVIGRGFFVYWPFSERWGFIH